MKRGCSDQGGNRGRRSRRWKVRGHVGWTWPFLLEALQGFSEASSKGNNFPKSSRSKQENTFMVWRWAKIS